MRDNVEGEIHAPGSLPAPGSHHAETRPILKDGSPPTSHWNQTPSARSEPASAQQKGGSAGLTDPVARAAELLRAWAGGQGVSKSPHPSAPFNFLPVRTLT